MRYLIRLQVLAALAALPAAAQDFDAPNVRVQARVVVIDREALNRAGVSYFPLGGDAVQVTSRSPRVRGGPLGIRAFLQLARERRWTRSESTQMILVQSGSPATVSSFSGSAGVYGGSTRGPSLSVVPTVLSGGRVRLQVSTGVVDQRQTVWGAHDRSPAWAETEVVARSGEEVTVASSSASESGGRSGILRISTFDRTRDMLIVLTPEIL